MSSRRGTGLNRKSGADHGHVRGDSRGRIGALTADVARRRLAQPHTRPRTPLRYRFDGTKPRVRARGIKAVSEGSTRTGVRPLFRVRIEVNGPTLPAGPRHGPRQARNRPGAAGSV